MFRCKRYKLAVLGGTRCPARSLARCRLALLRFAHRGRRYSTARRRQCIFCESAIEDDAVHVLCLCEAFKNERACAYDAIGITELMRRRDVAIRLLSVTHDVVGYSSVLKFVGAVEATERRFWKAL